MKSLLRRERFKSQYLDELTLQELSGQAFQRIQDARESGLVAGVVCQCGVVEWAHESPEDICANVGMAALQEIGEAIYRLSGIDLISDEGADAKNSEPALGADSSSG